MVSVNDKGQRVWDLQNPQDKADFEKLTDSNKKRLDIKVGIDDSVLNLAKENGELRAKVNQENPQTDSNTERANEVFEHLKTRISLEFDQQGLPTPKIENMQDIDNCAEIVGALKQKQTQSPAGWTGGSPLNSAQTGQLQKADTFSTHAQLVDALMQKEQYGSPDEKAQSKAVLDQMFRKTVVGSKNGKIENFNLPQNEPISDIVNQAYRKKKLAYRGSD